MIFGIDYEGGLSAAALKKANVRFVCRYVSPFAIKNLSPGEAAGLSAAGIGVVVVWESSAAEAENGFAAGVADARGAQAEAAACGMPDGRPIYMAVDEDTVVGPHITAYFQGVTSVLGHARVGAYGGFDVIRGLFDAKLITWGWQTYAWSAGRWDPRAQLRQYLNAQNIDGVDVDFDYATVADYGQWFVGGTDWSDVLMNQLPTLAEGATGFPVDNVQSLLNGSWREGAEPLLTVDNVFGPSTLARVKQEQAQHGLVADGIVGPKTWNLLLLNKII